MNAPRQTEPWRPVYDFWFPPGLEEADLATHNRMALWWMRGGATAELPPFAGTLEAAKAGRLDAWSVTPHGRLSLIVVLDQFPRGLHAGTAEAYASDAQALRLAEEGLRLGHYDALATPWERLFLVLPLVHAEGPDHRERVDRVVAMAEAVATTAPERLKPLYDFSASQARGHRDVIARFGRFPHRNSIVGRTSTPEEAEYLRQGDFVHLRSPPSAPSPMGRPSPARDRAA